MADELPPPPDIENEDLAEAVAALILAADRYRSMCLLMVNGKDPKEVMRQNAQQLMESEPVYESWAKKLGLSPGGQGPASPISRLGPKR
jgi:hypothetical protein